MSIDKKTLILIISAIFIVIIFVFIYIKFNDFGNSDDEYLTTQSVNTISSDNNVKKIIVHVSGCVVNEGVVELSEGARINDAINSAGGSTLDADLNKLNLAYPLKDGEKVYVPSVNDEDTVDTIVSSTSSQNSKGSDSGLININTATQSELETLSGIGPSTALKIIQYRKSNGDFNFIEDLKNVPGIGDSKFNTIKDSICV